MIQPGDRFERLVVLSVSGRNALCRCDCGNEKSIRKDNLIGGRTKSCGCLCRVSKGVPVPPGTKYGHLTVLSTEGKSVYCRCDCGNEKLVLKNNLLSSRTRSCGCIRTTYIIQPGTKFGRLTVLSIDRQIVHCRCNCGNAKDVLKMNLLNGFTKSCGCLRKKNWQPV